MAGPPIELFLQRFFALGSDGGQRDQHDGDCGQEATGQWRDSNRTPVLAAREQEAIIPGTLAAAPTVSDWSMRDRATQFTRPSQTV